MEFRVGVVEEPLRYRGSQGFVGRRSKLTKPEAALQDSLSATRV